MRKTPKPPWDCPSLCLFVFLHATSPSSFLWRLPGHCLYQQLQSHQPPRTALTSQQGIRQPAATPVCCVPGWVMVLASRTSWQNQWDLQFHRSQAVCLAFPSLQPFLYWTDSAAGSEVPAQHGGRPEDATDALGGSTQSCWSRSLTKIKKWRVSSQVKCFYYSVHVQKSCT